MDQTVCRMHTEPSWVLSLRFPFFPCPPMSKAQRQRKGLHLGCHSLHSERKQQQSEKRKNRGKKQPNKQGRRKERKYIFWMRKHQPWALPILRAERAEGLTLVTQRNNNNECYLPSEEVGFVTCDLSLMHRGREQLVPPPQGKCKLQLCKPLSCLLPSLQTAPPLHPTAGAKQEIVRLDLILPAASQHLFQAPFSRTQPSGACFQLPLQQSIL